MAHIYSHWGKGVYWDVVEILRDQDDYQFESDESSLQLLCDLIGCKDETKFLNWFKDSLNIGLFSLKDGFFYCPPLNLSMGVWETKKENGSKGGRPRKHKGKNLIKTEIKTQLKADRNHNRTEQNITEQKKDVYTVDDFLSDWRELRTKHLKTPTHIKNIPQHDKTKFREVSKSYARDDFKNAMIGLFRQKEFPNGNTTMRSNPSHFLNYFNSYFTAYHDKNENLYGKQTA